MTSTSRDHFFNGRIVLNQPTSGYRFSIDAVILAHLALPLASSRVVDLGTGCGVIPIMMAYRCPAIHLVGVEIQPALCAVARQNVADNHMADRIRILEADMRALSRSDVGGAVDLVVSNPPYRPLNSGRVSRDSQRAVARHELKIDLAAVLASARRMLQKTGRLAVIYPCVRTVDLLSAMRTAGLEPKSLTMVHTHRNAPARLVGVVAVKSGRPGLDVAPPLAIYSTDGGYSPALAAMIGA